MCAFLVAGLTFRLIRRTIVKSLYLILKFSGLLKLNETLRAHKRGWRRSSSLSVASVGSVGHLSAKLLPTSIQCTDEIGQRDDWWWQRQCQQRQPVSQAATAGNSWASILNKPPDTSDNKPHMMSIKRRLQTLINNNNNKSRHRPSAKHHLHLV